MKALNSPSLSCSSGIPTYGRKPLTFKLGFPISVHLELPRGHTQKCVPYVILDPVKSVIHVNYHREDPEKDSIGVGMSQKTRSEQKKGEGQKVALPQHEGSLWIGVGRYVFITGSEQLFGRAPPNTYYKGFLSPEL